MDFILPYQFICHAFSLVFSHYLHRNAISYQLTHVFMCIPFSIVTRRSAHCFFVFFDYDSTDFKLFRRVDLPLSQFYQLNPNNTIAPAITNTPKSQPPFMRLLFGVFIVLVIVLYYSNSIVPGGFWVMS